MKSCDILIQDSFPRALDFERFMDLKHFLQCLRFAIDGGDEDNEESVRDSCNSYFFFLNMDYYGKVDYISSTPHDREFWQLFILP